MTETIKVNLSGGLFLDITVDSEVGADIMYEALALYTEKYGQPKPEHYGERRVKVQHD